MAGIEKIIPIYDKVHKVLYFDESFFTDIPLSISKLKDEELLAQFNEINKELYNDYDHVQNEKLIFFLFMALEFNTRLIDSTTLFEKTYDFQENIILEKDLLMIILADWFYMTPPNSNYPHGRIKRFLTGEEKI